MKKYYLVLATLLVVAVLSTAVFASGSLSAAASADKSEAYRSDKISVVVSVGEISGDMGGISVAYDNAALELTSCEWLLSGAESRFNTAQLKGVFAYETAQTISGDFFKCVFTVKADATFYPTEITFTVKVGDQTVETKAAVTITCNHNFGGWISDGEHTHTHTCTICNGVETVEHTWNDGEVTTAASCSAEGVRTHACTGCGATKTSPIEKIAHKYSNSCDASCNVCGGERQITHKYSDKWTTDGNAHWHKCTVCGSKKDEEAHKPGPEPTEQTSQNCTVCGYIIKEALGHTHDYQLEWTWDTTGHWHACTGCQNQNEFTEHQFENTCDKDCDICGYERETEHIYYENYLSSEDGHWHECRVCGYQLEMEHHTPNESGMCTGCGYKTVAADHTHGFEGSWDWDASGHWQTCECGENSPAEPHSWDDGEVTKKPTDTADGARTYKCTVCGAQKTELIPMGTVITDSFPWVVVLIVGGVLILGVVVYIVIGVASSKKKAGRFSGEAYDEELETVEE